MTKIRVLEESHVDHGITEAQREWGLFHMGERLSWHEVDHVVVSEYELPEHLGTVPCGLHGPCMGHDPVPDAEVTREKRGDRTWTSRMVNRPQVQTRWVTVVVGPDPDAKGMTSMGPSQKPSWVLYTMYGGPQAPREPGDPSLTDAERAESEDFWSKHALSTS